MTNPGANLADELKAAANLDLTSVLDQDTNQDEKLAHPQMILIRAKRDHRVHARRPPCGDERGDE